MRVPAVETVSTASQQTSDSSVEIQPSQSAVSRLLLALDLGERSGGRAAAAAIFVEPVQREVAADPFPALTGGGGPVEAVVTAMRVVSGTAWRQAAIG